MKELSNTIHLKILLFSCFIRYIFHCFKCLFIIDIWYALKSIFALVNMCECHVSNKSLLLLLLLLIRIIYGHVIFLTSNASHVSWFIIRHTNCFATVVQLISRRIGNNLSRRLSTTVSPVHPQRTRALI